MKTDISVMEYILHIVFGIVLTAFVVYLGSMVLNKPFSFRNVIDLWLFVRITISFITA